MTKKKERRTPPPTMESIIHKAQVRLGEAEYKRSTDPKNKKAEDKKMAEEKKTEEKPKRKTSKNLIWGESQTLALMRAIIEHKDSRKNFLAATVGKLKSEAKTTDKTIYEAKLFKEKHIMSKAQAIVSRMKKDGYDISIPKKDAQSGGTDYDKMYAALGDLMPAKKTKRGR